MAEPQVIMETVDRFIDAWGLTRAPSSIELVREYKGLVYACANLNARAVAGTIMRLYVRTGSGLPVPKVLTRKRKAVAEVTDSEEVLEHPLLTLLRVPNPQMSGMELFELTQLYLEVEGNAYWLIVNGPLRVPAQLWLLPSQFVTAKIEEGRISKYEYNPALGMKQEYPPDEIVHFRASGLLSPYVGGFSPARAAFESISLLSAHHAYEASTLSNRARPDVVGSPKEPLNEAEADKLEKRLQRKLRRGGSGGLIVSEQGMELKPLNFSPKDLELVPIYQLSKTEVSNCFDVPMPLLEPKMSPRAQLEASHYQHAKLAVLPRCKRFADKLNSTLVPRFDERLFLEFDNPVPEDDVIEAQVRSTNRNAGVTTANEERGWMGLEPLEGGDVLDPPKGAPAMPGQTESKPEEKQEQEEGE